VAETPTRRKGENQSRMRATLETTQEGHFRIPRKVVIEIPDDHMPLDRVISDIIEPLLCGWGFDQNQVRFYTDPDSPSD
jgi:hypothetical protein